MQFCAKLGAVVAVGAVGGAAPTSAPLVDLAMQINNSSIHTNLERQHDIARGAARTSTDFENAKFFCGSQCQQSWQSMRFIVIAKKLNRLREECAPNRRLICYSCYLGVPTGLQYDGHLSTRLPPQACAPAGPIRLQPRSGLGRSSRQNILRMNPIIGTFCKA